MSVKEVTELFSRSIAASPSVSTHLSFQGWHTCYSDAATFHFSGTERLHSIICARYLANQPLFLVECFHDLRAFPLFIDIDLPIRGTSAIPSLVAIESSLFGQVSESSLLLSLLPILNELFPQSAPTCSIYSATGLTLLGAKISVRFVFPGILVSHETCLYVLKYLQSILKCNAVLTAQMTDYIKDFSWEAAIDLFAVQNKSGVRLPLCDKLDTNCLPAGRPLIPVGVATVDKAITLVTPTHPISHDWVDIGSLRKHSNMPLSLFKKPVHQLKRSPQKSGSTQRCSVGKPVRRIFGAAKLSLEEMRRAVMLQTAESQWTSIPNSGALLLTIAGNTSIQLQRGRVIVTAPSELVLVNLVSYIKLPLTPVPPDASRLTKTTAHFKSKDISFSPGEWVTVIENAGDLAKVSMSSKTGWVPIKYL